MTKLIAAVIIAAVLYGGWQLFFYWERVQKEEEVTQKQQAASVNPGSLAGMPYQLEQSLQAAEKKGASGLREWLKTYGPSIQDPRKAWIELDYCTLIVRDDPAEARRIFKTVKDRTPATSPVFDRVKKLEKSYE
jgi:hypothetical protein